MPRKRRMRGRGNELQSIATANRNIELIEFLKRPKPPLQKTGHSGPKVGSGRKQKGGAYAYVDKYGQWIRAY